MNRMNIAAALLGFALAATACQSSNAPSGPSSLAAMPGGIFVVGANGAALKANAPVAQTPVSGVTTSLTPLFLVSGGGLTYSTAAVQYRFRIKDGAGAVIDSGLQNTPAWTPTAPLTPTTQYEWNARAEYAGGTGPWSVSVFFSTPVPPGNDYGAWEATCRTLFPDEPAIAGCVWQFVRPTDSFGAFEVVKRVAWLLRSRGAGLLLKSSGENVIPWMGVNYSASRVCYPDGHIYKVTGDTGPGGVNSPGWADNDFVDVSLYQPAIDPRLR